MTFIFVKSESLFDCADFFEPFTCRQCINFETYKLVDLKRHFEAHHPVTESEEKRYVCENCNFETFSKFLSLVHRSNPCRKHVEVNTKTSTSHRKKKTETSKIFKCAQCPYTDKRPSSLKRHILCRHTAPDKIHWFECEHCPYKCKIRSSLKNHVSSMHDDRKPIKCDQCSFATKLTARLTSHIRNRHTDPREVRWFQCDRCTFRSKIRATLNYHVRHRHDAAVVQPVLKKLKQCEYCPYSTRGGNLKRHVLNKHTDPVELRWFQCEHCNFRTKTRFRLRTHTEGRHFKGGIIGKGRYAERQS